MSRISNHATGKFPNLKTLFVNKHFLLLSLGGKINGFCSAFTALNKLWPGDASLVKC